MAASSQDEPAVNKVFGGGPGHPGALEAAGKCRGQLTPRTSGLVLILPMGHSHVRLWGRPAWGPGPAVAPRGPEPQEEMFANNGGPQLLQDNGL